MLTINKILPRLLMLLALLSIRCDDHDKDSFNCASVMCTEEFRSVVLTIKNIADDTPFRLTGYKVTRVSDNKDITLPFDNYMSGNGYYPLANDSQIELFRFKNVEIEFRGYLNNNLVIQRRFTITADCCHISLVEGETSAYL